MKRIRRINEVIILDDPYDEKNNDPIKAKKWIDITLKKRLTNEKKKTK